MTPYQHPLVDKAPETQRLHLATGGSYHSFKFLPNFGDMVVRYFRGQSGSDTPEHRLLQRWTWERSKETVAVHKSVIPKAS
jgi:sarcosine oxidase/L-pipecolate oxidase